MKSVYKLEERNGTRVDIFLMFFLFCVSKRNSYIIDFFLEVTRAFLVTNSAFKYKVTVDEVGIEHCYALITNNVSR